MTFSKKLREVQHSLSELALPGWLLYDYRGSNPLARHFLEILPSVELSRRFCYFIPSNGEPVKIVPSIEPYTLDHLPGHKVIYTGWKEFHLAIFRVLNGYSKVAMEYSPLGALPNISKVDAGMVDLVRQSGSEVVSSANILQLYTSVMNASQVKSQQIASVVLEETVVNTWNYIREAISQGDSLNEYEVQQFILSSIEKGGCIMESFPACAVNAHSADPHYHPTKKSALPIKKGDFVLIDLWCKQKVPHAIYADITRVAVVSDTPTERQENIFKIVRGAQQTAIDKIQEYFERDEPLFGWQVDQFCREYIEKEGYGKYFIHRTGHNLGEEVHGPGANLDNFETHDDRLLLRGSSFTIEPGIYLPHEFGVRLEVDIYVDLAKKVHVLGGLQEKIECLC